MLSKWVRDIVMPQAVQEITAVIDKRNEEARERKRNWEDEQRKRVNQKLESKVGKIKPREIVYPPFDRSRLVMGRPRVVPDAPEEGDGERLGWTSWWKLQRVLVGKEQIIRKDPAGLSQQAIYSYLSPPMIRISTYSKHQIVFVTKVSQVGDIKHSETSATSLDFDSILSMISCLSMARFFWRDIITKRIAVWKRFLCWAEIVALVGSNRFGDVAQKKVNSSSHKPTTTAMILYLQGPC